MDSFPVMKSVEIYEDLSYKITVANIDCPVEFLHPELPSMPLHDFRSVEGLLLAVENSCLCQGMSNVQYQHFEPEIFGVDGIVKGRSRYVWAASKPNDKKKVYFSNACLGLMFSTASKKICLSCQNLDAILRVKLWRYRNASPGDGSCSSTAICHLNADQLRLRLADQQRKRYNAERREKYAKDKVRLEKEAKRVTESNHSDLRLMMDEIDKHHKEEDLFPGEPGMSLFWQIQKDMVQRGS